MGSTISQSSSSSLEETYDSQSSSYSSEEIYYDARSSSSSSKETYYNVFLSFRGEDTRNNFTSHLYAALCRKKVETFMDDGKLKRGEEIKQSLIEAIEESLLWVVIFSKDYASSRWCLDELEKILECKKRYGRIVIPVFYHVYPTDVRNQTGSYGDAFAKHEKLYKRSSDKLQKWRAALTEVAGQAGYDSNVIRNEAELTERIVEDVIKRLCEMSPSVNDDGLVGMQLRIIKMESLLSIDLKGVRRVGIVGMGGIGKTTLARAVFNKISNQFEISYFIESVRESEENGRLVGLRQELFSALLEDKNLNVATLQLTSFIRQRLKRKNALIVMDDVTDFGQIVSLLVGSESLIDCFDLFGSRSRIIITTRDKKVLMDCRVHEVYKLEGLLHNDAIKLFRMHAFTQNHSMENFHQLSDRIVRHFDGIPLAIKVFGSFLRDRKIQEWENTVNKRKRNFKMDVQKVLKISFDRLGDEVKRIFLDIACFFKHTRRDLVINILDASDVCTEFGIDILVEHCLISTLGDKLTMHDLVQQMAREIVMQEANSHPGKCSRLWRQEDICQVLTKNTGTELIEGILLNMQGMEEIHLNPDVFAKMHGLRILKFCNSGCEASINKVYVSDHGLVSNFSRLTYLQWDGCPLKNLQTSFHLRKLVVLRLPNSNIEELWNGIQPFPNLKVLDVRFSERLTTIPNLSLAPNLERLILSGCTSLVEVHISIQYLKKLVILDLSYCITLRIIPTCIRLLSLKKFYLFSCSNLTMLPELPCNLEILFANGTAIEELPSSVSCLSRLLDLRLENCSRLKNLSISFSKLISLQFFCLCGCLKLDHLPGGLSRLPALHTLHAKGTAIGEQHSTFDFGSYNFKWKTSSPGFGDLQELDATNCCLKKLPEDINFPHNLRILKLSGNAFKSLPESISYHTQLWWLDISHCQELISLPELPPNLEFLDAYSCTSLEPSSELCSRFTISNSSKQKINFLNCFKLEDKKLNEIMKDVPLRVCEYISLSFLSMEFYCMRKESKDRQTLEKAANYGLISPHKNMVERIQNILAQKSDLTLDDILKTVEKMAEIEHIPEWRGLLRVTDFLKDAQQESADVTTWRIASYLLYIMEAAEWRLFRGSLFDRASSYTCDPYYRDRMVKDVMSAIAQEIIWQNRGPIDSYEICYPGNQIPEWLASQSEGPRVTLELKAGSIVNRYLGFIACAVVSFKGCYFDGKDSRVVIKCKCRLKLANSTRNINMSRMEVVSPNLTLDSDHVFLGFYRRNNFKDCYRDKASFEFSVLDRLYRPLERSEVKKCGVCFVAR